MGAPLLKTQTVLTLDDADAEMPCFSTTPDEGDATRETMVLLDREVWEEMEKPGTITVTVEPGDKLNEEEPK